MLALGRQRRGGSPRGPAPRLGSRAARIPERLGSRTISAAGRGLCGRGRGGLGGRRAAGDSRPGSSCRRLSHTDSERPPTARPASRRPGMIRVWRAAAGPRRGGRAALRACGDSEMVSDRLGLTRTPLHISTAGDNAWGLHDRGRQIGAPANRRPPPPQAKWARLRPGIPSSVTAARHGGPGPEERGGPGPGIHARPGWGTQIGVRAGGNTAGGAPARGRGRVWGGPGGETRRRSTHYARTGGPECRAGPWVPGIPAGPGAAAVGRRGGGGGEGDPRGQSTLTEKVDTRGTFAWPITG